MNHNFLYHATFKPLLKKIQQEGLGGKSSKKLWDDSKSGLVYLATDPEIAGSFTESAFDENEDLPESWEDKIVVLVIDANKLDQFKLSLDKNIIDNDGHSLEYNGIIPWDFVIDIIRYS